MGISKGEPPTKKRKSIGGIRQRIAAAEAAEAERSSSSSQGQSALAKFLIESWAKGELSPQKVQQIAELAFLDMSQIGNVQFKTLEKLAALGNHGASAQNCHRDLLHLAKLYSKLPQPSLHSIHFKKKTSVQNIFLPHEVFASLFHDYPETWKEVILPHSGKLKEFWKVAKNHPCMEGHPLEASGQQWAIPLSVHGDGVPTSGAGKVSCKMFTNFSWGSLLGEGSTALMQQYIWGLLTLWELKKHWMTFSRFLLGASLVSTMEHGLLQTTWVNLMLLEVEKQLELDVSLLVVSGAYFLAFLVT